MSTEEPRAGRRGPGGGDGARGRAAAERARSQLRRGSERARRADERISRGLGEPALFAILLSSVVSGLFMVLGVVAGDALGLTPLAFLLSGLLFVFTIATYVEGSSLHPERGGASTFARYAFNELWSFIAGWAILLDYLIVMAIGAVAIGGLPRGVLGPISTRASWRSSSPAWRSCTSPPRTCAASAPSGSAWSCGCRCSASCCWRPCRGSRSPRTGTRSRSPTASSSATSQSGTSSCSRRSWRAWPWSAWRPPRVLPARCAWAAGACAGSSG